MIAFSCPIGRSSNGTQGRLLPALLLGVGFVAGSASAQGPAPQPPDGAAPAAADVSHRPVLSATRAASPPTLDGDVLNDSAWRGLPAASGFVQTTPDEGEPASERTEVFVTYDAETLYFGVVCYDREPTGIIVSDSRRDADLDETDSFQVVLDTYDDSQTGFVFGTNPAGIQYDGQSGDDGQSFNRNWDGAWRVQALIADFGWSAELAIPFRTLRFPRRSPQSWGINFQRNIRRHNERSFWAPLPLQFSLNRVSLAGKLDNLEVPRQRLLQLTPYVVATAAEGPEIDGTETETDAGFDVKYGLTPSLTLDATYNTDFAQVEADVQQINLDRFNLFFPEKRPFFLENSGLFSVGVPQEVELFFSRRIGIGDQGETLPILGGLRLSGKAGRYNVGLLHMATDDAPGSGAKDEFSVMRLSRDLGNRSSLGMIVTRRQTDGPALAGGDPGYTYGIDGRWGLNQRLELMAFAAETDNPDVNPTHAPADDRREHAYRVGMRYNSERYSSRLSYTEVGDDFNPAVGFLARRGFRKADGFILARFRPDDWYGIQELRPHISYRGFWDFDGFQETGYLHIDNHWEWKNGHEVHTGVNLTREGVKEPFEIFPGVIVPAGTYDHSEALIVAFTNRGAAVSANIRLIIGGFFGGDRVATSPSITFRRGEKLNGELAWSHNDIDLPGGSFETNLGRLRLAYSFSPKVFVDGLVQYNDRSDRWSSNIRFGWRRDASTGFFVVYNDIQELGRDAGEPRRRLILKYSRLLNLFKG